MSSKVETAAVSMESKPVGAHPRIVALMALAAMVAVLAFIGRGIYLAFVDSWLAPITLSPENDQVLQITVKLNEQQLLREKLRTDIERIDADIIGIDSAIAQLKAVRESGHEALRWTSFTTNAQSAAGQQRMRALDEQRKLFETMLARQESITKNAKRNAAAGLASSQDTEREEQTLDQLRLGLSSNRREMTDTRMQNAQFFATASVLRNTLEHGTGVEANGTLPEIAAGQDRVVAMQLEIIKLEAEKRANVTQRQMSVESMDRMDELFKQLKARPVYRAIQAKTDVAFVPYTQLDGVEAGSTLIACAWTLFRCRPVGRIAEVLPGEVVAQDPWSNVARGQYVILDLSDHDAVKEKVLRARPMH